jgi:hypothetical protein
VEAGLIFIRSMLQPGIGLRLREVPMFHQQLQTAQKKRSQMYENRQHLAQQAGSVT